MKKFIVLGGYGIIGRVVVLDLFQSCKNCDIIIAGRDLKKAKEYADSFKSNRVKARKINIDDEKGLVRLLKEGNVCVNCLQYYFNVEIMKACLKARVHYLDLGGLFHETKKQIKLDNAFKKIGKTAILGCGATPGITNVMAAYGANFLKKIEKIEIVFADKDETDYEQSFVLPYSFKTIIDEYTMKPAVFKNGKMIFVKPHSGLKEEDFGRFGKQKGFYTLHSELATFLASFKEKGVKNIEFRATFEEDFSKKIIDLIELGFTKGIIKIDRKKLNILDVSAAIMDKWLPRKGTKIKDEELLRVNLDNRIIMDAIVKTRFNIPAGSYDTGVPCSIIAQMINGLPAGVFAPEKIINTGFFFKELNKRGIRIYKNGKEI